MSMHPKVIATVVFATLGLSACGSTGSQQPLTSAAVAPTTMPAMSAGPDFGPVLTSDGRCTGTSAGAAGAIAPGIGECDLVRLKGKPPTDVLIGEGKGTREVQVLYSEPGGRELYLFVDNRLDRILK
ncbi:hypothetical protein [Microvirga antarctica]|uniref:hypothetical protein n=1 Tax=Microvirga antarctica TaxID=2819233 RepID=UPI001B311200|nr:hypothetical protein [Microvirga antarctica]